MSLTEVYFHPPEPMNLGELLGEVFKRRLTKGFAGESSMPAIADVSQTDRTYYLPSQQSFERDRAQSHEFLLFVGSSEQAMLQKRRVNRGKMTHILLDEGGKRLGNSLSIITIGPTSEIGHRRAVGIARISEDNTLSLETFIYSYSFRG